MNTVILSWLVIMLITTYRALGRFFPECRRPSTGSEMDVHVQSEIFHFSNNVHWYNYDKSSGAGNRSPVVPRHGLGRWHAKKSRTMNSRGNTLGEFMLITRLVTEP